jgi:hypothetical protein
MTHSYFLPQFIPQQNEYKKDKNVYFCAKISGYYGHLRFSYCIQTWTQYTHNDRKKEKNKNILFLCKVYKNYNNSEFSKYYTNSLCNIPNGLSDTNIYKNENMYFLEYVTETFTYFKFLKCEINVSFVS